MENNKNLEVFSNMPVPKAVMKNALPAMAAMLMVLVYNLADTFFIGQTHNALLVAAVSLATPVYLIFMSLGTLFGIGGTSVISRALGEGNKEKARKSCAFCFWGCVFVGILLAALILIFIDPILSLIGASADTYEYAKSYLSIIVFAGPFVLISNCYGNVIRTEGESGKAMLGLLLGNLVNIILDSIFILALGLDIKGAATSALLISMSRQGIIFIPALFILQAVVGMTGLVWAQPVADVLSILIAAILFGKTMKKMQII